MRALLLASAVAFGWAVLPGTAQAALVTTFYGDNDGFGIGATSGTINPLFTRSTPTEAPGTDTALLGTGQLAPAFTPGGSFGPFVIPAGDTITAASLTIRFGSFNPTNPISGPNILRLDGVDFAALLSAFTANLGGGDAIETRTLALPSSFFPNLADGAVSLTGTRISEGVGFGLFAVDFLRLDITTVAATVPEPATLALLGTGVLVLGMVRRKRRGA